MIMQTQILKLRNITLAVIFGALVFTLMATDVNAEGRKRIYSLSAIKAKAIVTNEITAKLKSDLFNQNVQFQFRTVKEFKTLDGKFVMKGDGFCVLTKSNDKMPLTFETVIASSSNQKSEIKYNFVDSNERSQSYAPSVEEDRLMTVLLRKISQDSMTQDVVIAIDDSKGVIRSDSKQAMVGYGEVKIRNGSWKRVEFSVELSLDKKTTKHIVYKLN